MTDIAERLEAFASVWPTAYDSDRQNIALLREAAAEIGRLRGEVERLPAWIIGWMAAREILPDDDGDGIDERALIEALDNHERELLSAIPKPAPAMSNGVEASPANCRERLRLEGRPYPRSGCAHCKLGGLTGCPYEKGVHNSGRAADNRDAAGVCDCPGIGKADKALHAPNCPVRTTPAAVPAGEAVAWLASDGEVFTDKESADRHSKVWGVNPLLTPLYTTQPAPVQAASQEGEVPQLVRYGRGSAESPYLLDQRDDGYWTPWHVAQRELARALAAHPSACELGADDVGEIIARDKRVWALAGLAEKCGAVKDEGESGLFWTLTLGDFYKLEAALQHRGDSRSGEGSGG